MVPLSLEIELENRCVHHRGGLDRGVNVARAEDPPLELTDSSIIFRRPIYFTALNVWSSFHSAFEN